MKVYIHRRPGTDMKDVYLYREGLNGKKLQMVLVGPDAWENREVTEGDTVEPSLSFPGEILEAILKEAMHVLPPSEAQPNHLADAIAVRERILDHFLKS